MKKSITYLVLFIFTLVSNRVVSQSATASTIATVKIVGPLSITKNVDLNFGTISASTEAGSVTVATDGKVNTFGGVTVVDQSLISAASFAVFGPANTSFTIGVPGWVELKNDLNASISLYGVTTDPNGSGTLDSNGTARILLGASITVNASQGDGVYQGDLEVTINLN